jgi:CubicO group peptidase (beta-lactamase class C family)
VLSVAVALLLSVTLPAAMVLLAGESGRWRRPARAAAVGVLVLVLGVDLAYGWAWASTDRSRLARTIVWQESDVLDCRRFPARAVATRPPPFQFRRSVGADRLPAVTVPVRRGGQVVERDLEGFLRSTGTTGFLVLKGDTLVSEAYFHGYRHDSTVSSFSVAKPVVSALVGIAIAQGRIGSVDDPVTRYLPELVRRDQRFGRITLRPPAHHERRAGRPGPLLRSRPPRRGPAADPGRRAARAAVPVQQRQPGPAWHGP